MSTNAGESSIRFRMVKARHKKRLEEAIKKGEADELIIELCRFINSKKNFFTTSSCSGRILLLGVKGKGKNNAYFHRKWHSKVKFEDIWNALHENTEGELWLKMESFIMHIGAFRRIDALKLLQIKDRAGIKRGGIIAIKPGKIIVELIGTEDVAIPVKLENRIIVSEDFLRDAVMIINRKMEENLARLKIFEREIKERLK
ncbi:MAG: hypothetical protein QXM75_02005 [Candidatus Diapherotrites archaeon]